MGHASDEGYLVTPQLSLSCPRHAANKTGLVQTMTAREVKQATYGETRTANIKKKLMKNQLKNEAATPANAVQQASTRAERVTVNPNRELPTQTVLELLKKELPKQYELAEIVGQWVWLDFPKTAHRAAALTLYRLGFHWNQRRSLWQHPCGAFTPYASHPGEPRAKYGSQPVTRFQPA